MTFTPPARADMAAAVREYHRARLAWLAALYAPVSADAALDAYEGLGPAVAGLVAFLKACGGRVDVTWGDHGVTHKLDDEGRIWLERSWPGERVP